MALAVEQIRRMRGGAQSHLMRCSDGSYYVVKFQNNPQGLRVLANELLGTRLAARLGLRVPRPEVIEVREELIANTEDLVIQLGRGRAPCRPGKQFGSRYPGHPGRDGGVRLPSRRAIAPGAEPCGFLRHAGIRQVDLQHQRAPGDFLPGCGRRARRRANDPARYSAEMIDNGFCFNAGEWNFPDAPLRGLYARHRVYESVRGIECFDGLAGARGTDHREHAGRDLRRRFRRNGMRTTPTRSRRCWSSCCGGASWCGN